MEEKIIQNIKLNRILIIIIGILLICSIIINLYFFKQSKNSITNNSKVNLPNYLTKNELNGLMKNIQDYYNNKKNKELYELLGETAKTQITYEDFLKSIKQIDVIGEIEKFNYASFDFIKSEKGSVWFYIYFTTRFDKGNGETKLTIKCSEENYELLGFYFNIKNLGK